MRMRRLLPVVLALSVCLCARAEAGDPAGLHGWKGPEGRLDALNLSAEQRAQLDAARAALRDGVARVREQVQAGTLTPKEAKEQIRPLREALKAAIQGILADEQRALLSQPRPNRGASGLRALLGDKPRDGLWQALELTDDQKTQLKALFAARREHKGKVPVGGNRLTPEERRALRQQQKETMRAEMARILTPEQLAKLDALRASRAQGRRNTSQGEEATPSTSALKSVPSPGTATPQKSWGQIKASRVKEETR